MVSGRIREQVEQKSGKTRAEVQKEKGPELQQEQADAGTTSPKKSLKDHGGAESHHLMRFTWGAGEKGVQGSRKSS